MKYPPTAESCRISEIFSSLQGEGTHLGERHIFVRFEECHIHCEYCDELDKVGTPMTQADVLTAVQKLEAENGPHSYISLTGGEPLIYLKFLKPLLKNLKKSGFKIYLETDGILFQALREVIDDCDVIAMDMKPSSVTKEKKFNDEHRQFLDIAKHKETFVKIVTSKEIDSGEFLDLVKIIKDISSKTPLIIQPITTTEEGYKDKVLMAKLEHLQKEALQLISDVRIVPRFHKIINVR